MKYQTRRYIAWSVSFIIIHYCPTTEWTICSVKFIFKRYRQAIYCMLNFLRWRWRRIYTFHFFFFNVCNKKLKSLIYFLQVLHKPKVHQSNNAYDHILISLKPSKSCNGTYKGDSSNSAFVISCINANKIIV
jgi:hypothetical protein